MGQGQDQLSSVECDALAQRSTFLTALFSPSLTVSSVEIIPEMLESSVDVSIRMCVEFKGDIHN